jgi:hypothetical protein
MSDTKEVTNTTSTNRTTGQKVVDATKEFVRDAAVMTAAVTGSALTLRAAAAGAQWIRRKLIGR